MECRGPFNTFCYKPLAAPDEYLVGGLRAIIRHLGSRRLSRQRTSADARATCVCSREPYRFGVFTFDPFTLELWKAARPVRVRPQSLKLLALLSLDRAS